ncbi:branched-chain amino acid ABC transporter permease [Roseicyclus sp. F158]|uniref:Branched-chain amino acid ABC transporter permease n=1 Tax=Tropicimonas omnivorans TaxID=3075590 RepID=A0ABU3DI25_9RHOB|nr:branched-chain amino acid ABC transporter permease [Roseicyclus sp. F158]MDT0683331.1 branched-chain amino acid ABC transporter permease [Roseicyclus sp. F158]
MSSALTRTTSGPRAMALLWAVALVAVALIPWITGSTFHFHIAIMVCISAMATGGLAVTAWVGQLSLAHAAFAGIGAYTSVLLVTRLDLPVLLGLPAGALVAGGVAFVIGAPLLRLRGVYFVLITFALNELFRLVMLEIPEYSGGSSGIAGIPKISLFGATLSSYEAVYPFALVCLALVMGLLVLIRKGQLGRRFGAVEENLALAEASGIPTARTQNLAFTIGSAIAGFAGAFLAHYVGFISPETFGFQLSVSYVIMLVTGGRLALWGPLVGALFLTPLPEFLRGAVEYQHIIYGVILIAVLRFLPQGLAGLPAQLSRKEGRA